MSDTIDTHIRCECGKMIGHKSGDPPLVSIVKPSPHGQIVWGRAERVLDRYGVTLDAHFCIGIKCVCGVTNKVAIGV